MSDRRTWYPRNTLWTFAAAVCSSCCCSVLSNSPVSLSTGCRSATLAASCVAFCSSSSTRLRSICRLATATCACCAASIAACAGALDVGTTRIVSWRYCSQCTSRYTCLVISTCLHRHTHRSESVVGGTAVRNRQRASGLPLVRELLLICCQLQPTCGWCPPEVHRCECYLQARCGSLWQSHTCTSHASHAARLPSCTTLAANLGRTRVTTM